MNEILSWILALLPVPLTASYLAPIIAGSRLRPPDTLFWPLSVGLGIGIFTILVTIIAFTGLTPGHIWLILATLWSISALWGNWPRLRVVSETCWSQMMQGKISKWVWVAKGLIFLVVLGHASYYPFTGDDEISRYAYLARLLLEKGKMAAEVRGYPALLPAAYASTFIASSGIHEQAAKMYPVLMSAMTIWATYALALQWFGRIAAAVAGLTLAATPLFINWAPIGYLDITTGLYFVLCAFALELWRRRLDTGWAIVTGILAGLALWTKQAGFAMLPIIGIVVITQAMRSWKQHEPTIARLTLKHGLLILAVALASCGWWYLRNALYDGWGGAIPDAGLYHLLIAPRNPLQLIPFLGNFLDFGWLTAPLYIAGLAYALNNTRNSTVHRLLLYCVPYTILWWWRFSFDARLLLAVLPFYAILVGATGASAWRHIVAITPYRAHQFIGIIVIILITAAGIYQAKLGGLLQWATNPSASYAQRLTRAKGDLYPTVQFLQMQIDPSTIIYSTDVRIRYYLIDRPIIVGYPNMSNLKPGDILVIGSWSKSVYNELGLQNNPLPHLDDNQLFKKLYTGPSDKLAVFQTLPS